MLHTFGVSMRTPPQAGAHHRAGLEGPAIEKLR